VYEKQKNMKDGEKDLERVLKYMQDHAIKLSRRSRDFLLKEFPSLKDKIEKAAQEKKESSKPQTYNPK
jgi:hypothetical protein